ncbi:MAG: monooxygenase [Microbacterium sp.]|jgi:FMN-dependent oxidoreductase (nitrilotriacetate monooxygenase family)|nr:monooxygenase [Microbacterium sp.]
MILGAFQTMNPNGTVGVSWRDAQNTSLDFLTIDYWTKLARQIEAAGFDFLFFADSYGYPTNADGEILDRALIDATNIPMADPITLVSAVAAATSSLGIVVTSSTQVERAPAVARRYGTLDHLTGGRIGWNIVTGAAQASSAALFGEDMMLHDKRYAQAEDHATICLKLWEGSWEDGALVADKTAGVYADPARVHQIEHRGALLSAKGVYGVPPGPQRTPFLLQAGTSRAGMDFAARFAELVFIGGGDTETIKAQIADLRGRLPEAGRPVDAIKFVVGAHFVLGADAATADDARARMLEFATLEQAATTYTWLTGIDLTAFPPHEPLPDLYTEMGQSSVDRYMNPQTGIRKTPHEVLTEFRDNGINGTVFVGSGATVADRMEEFLSYVNADGFLVQPHVTPGTYDAFIEHLVPELRRRGHLRESSTPGTLRARIFPEIGDHLPDTHVGTSFRATPSRP